MKNTKLIIFILTSIFSINIHSQNGVDANGKKHGPWQVTVQGIKVFEGYYNSGIRDGEFKTYYHGSGKLENHNNFSNNKLNGIQRAYSETGVLLWKATYTNGIKTGIETKYYENGNKKAELTYNSLGKLIGDIKTYNEDGSEINIKITAQ